MNVTLIFIWIYAAMVVTGFWESYVEGRNSWNKGKLGWHFTISKNFILDAYHFYLFFLMFPILITLPLIIYGWDTRLFGILLSAYFSGIIIEDFVWYIANPVVKLREMYTHFSDYYPWLKVNGHKIIPAGYFISLIISLLSWFFLWR